MSFESATNRIQDLRTMLGTPLPEAPTGPSTTSGPSAGAFAQALAQAQSQALQTVQQGLPGAPDDSPASGLPVLDASAMPGSLSTLGQYGMPTGAGSAAYGLGATPYGMAGSSGTLGVMPYGGGYPVGAAYPTTPFPGGGTAGERMLALAQRELGVRETDGSNESPRIREYRTATAGAQNTPGPWCAYFVSWLAQQSGAPVGPGGTGIGYVPNLEAWGRQTGRWFAAGSATPQPGDIVIFNRSGGVADHTGVVERVDADGTLHTIEGNTSDMVARRDYPAGGGGVTGFVRPG